MTTIVYTDGACSGNPGPGGWAWVVPDGPSGSGGEPHTTNQRMELMAALEAVSSLEGELEVRSDSSYLVNCFHDRWWEGWIRRGWLNSQKQPVANRDLWEPLVAAYKSRKITFSKVKGHSGDRWNDAADRLAVAAISQGVPSATKAGDVLPAGYRMLVTGHRPQDLGGYDNDLISAAIGERFRAVLAAQLTLHPDLVVVSGMALGSETLGAEAALDVGVPLAVVLAFPGFDSKWPTDTKKRFEEIVSAAETVLVRERNRPQTTQAAGAAIARMQGWLRGQIEEAIVVWNGNNGPVASAVASLRQVLGEENVWVIDAP